MKYTLLGCLALWAIFPQYSIAISITPTDDADAIASQVFNGPGVSVISAALQASTRSPAAGTFIEGPFGIGSGGILTTGYAANAALGGNTNIFNGAEGSTEYCGANTQDGTVLTVQFSVSTGYVGVEVQLILASEEQNP